MLQMTVFGKQHKLCSAVIRRDNLPGVKRWLTFGVIRQTSAISRQARAPALTPAIMKGVVWPRRRDCSTNTTNVHSPFEAQRKGIHSNQPLLPVGAVSMLTY